MDFHSKHSLLHLYVTRTLVVVSKLSLLVRDTKSGELDIASQMIITMLNMQAANQFMIEIQLNRSTEH